MVSNRPTNGYGEYAPFSKTCSSCSKKKELHEFGVKQETVGVVINNDLWNLLETCIKSDIELTREWLDQEWSEREYKDVHGPEYGKKAMKILNKIVNGKKSYRKTAEGDYIVPMHEHDIHVLFDALDAYREGDYIVPMHEHDIHVLFDALDAYREFVFNTYSDK